MPMSAYEIKVIERLMKKRIITESNCWEWIGFRQQGGYGYSSFNGRSMPVTRIIMHIMKGFDLASELDICHHCDNPPCFNPEHLFPETHQFNINDAKLKKLIREIKVEMLLRKIK